jgi:hypothetical protein
MKHKTGIILMIIGGVMMILSSAVGSIGVYEFLSDYVSTEVNPDLKPLLEIVIKVIRFIADWGGGAIIFGAFLIIVNQYRLGKWIIGIGLTFGSLALILWVITQIIDITGIVTNPQVLIYLDRLEGFFTYGASLQFLGVTVAIFGRWFIKKPKKEKKVKESKADGKETESGTQESSENKFCPDCGASISAIANFCNECGSTFDDR